MISCSWNLFYSVWMLDLSDFIVLWTWSSPDVGYFKIFMFFELSQLKTDTLSDFVLNLTGNLDTFGTWLNSFRLCNFICLIFWLLFVTKFQLNLWDGNLLIIRPSRFCTTSSSRSVSRTFNSELVILKCHHWSKWTWPDDVMVPTPNPRRLFDQIQFNST